MKHLPALLLCSFLWATAGSAAEPWPQGSQNLFQKAQTQPDYAAAETFNPTYYPTSDGKSFIAVWTPGNTAPHKWLVSLPGTHGFATKDLSLWVPKLEGRDIGLVDIQWWLGTGDSPKDYYAPKDIYHEIDLILTKLGVAPGSAMLQGFSRGAANLYAVAAIDRTQGRQFFSYYVANSGGASLGYPPTQQVTDGKFGAQPFAGTKWVTSCGAKDPHPDRDGCPGMQRTAEWLKGLGGDVVLVIEDPNEGHGALQRNPENTKRLLDLFEDK